MYLGKESALSVLGQSLTCSRKHELRVDEGIVAFGLLVMATLNKVRAPATGNAAERVHL